MKVEDFYNESEYSKIDFGSNPTLFSKKELLDFAKEYVEAINYSQCCKQLNDEKKLSFGLWRIKCKDVEAVNKDLWTYKGVLKNNDELKQIYNQVKQTF